MRDSSLVCRPLARTRDVIVATPVYLSRHPLQDELDAGGTLKPLLSEFSLDDDERTVWILYSGQAHMEIAVRRFVDFVVARYRQNSAQSNANPQPLKIPATA